MAATANTHDTKNAVKQLGNRAEIAASSGPATRLPSFPPFPDFSYIIGAMEASSVKPSA